MQKMIAPRKEILPKIDILSCAYMLSMGEIFNEDIEYDKDMFQSFSILMFGLVYKTVSFSKLKKLTDFHWKDVYDIVQNFWSHNLIQCYSWAISLSGNNVNDWVYDLFLIGGAVTYPYSEQEDDKWADLQESEIFKTYISDSDKMKKIITHLMSEYKTEFEYSKQVMILSA